MQTTKREEQNMSIFSIFVIFCTDVGVKSKYASNEDGYSC